jgi:putative membrane protein
VLFGWKRSILFTISGYFIAFASEFISTRYGFPYGLYHYIQEPTLHKELWILNVPFMDSLSYSFLAFFSFTMAIVLMSPIYRKGFRIEVADTKKIRRSSPVLFLGAFLMVCIDIIVDPASNQGDKWFLGKLYYYETSGYYHGVPLSNFLGWYLVAFLIISSYQRIDALLDSSSPFDGGLKAPYKGLYGVALYFGIMGFILSVTFFMVKDYALGISGIFVAMPIFAWFLCSLLKPANQATPEEIQEHLKDFPNSALADIQPPEENK